MPLWNSVGHGRSTWLLRHVLGPSPSIALTLCLYFFRPHRSHPFLRLDRRQPLKVGYPQVLPKRSSSFPLCDLTNQSIHLRRGCHGCLSSGGTLFCPLGRSLECHIFRIHIGLPAIMLESLGTWPAARRCRQ
jgi:hypothetical protein